MLSFTEGKPSRNFSYAVFGVLFGFVEVGVCILSGVLHGDFTIGPSTTMTVGIFCLAVVTVLLQASTEEIQCRSFLFGKMNNEGVPLVTAVLVSSVYFSLLHANNSGFGLIPALFLFLDGVLYALSYHYFGTIWFASCII